MHRLKGLRALYKLFSPSATGHTEYSSLTPRVSSLLRQYFNFLLKGHAPNRTINYEVHDFKFYRTNLAQNKTTNRLVPVQVGKGNSFTRTYYFRGWRYVKTQCIRCILSCI